MPCIDGAAIPDVSRFGLSEISRMAPQNKRLPNRPREKRCGVKLVGLRRRNLKCPGRPQHVTILNEPSRRYSRAWPRGYIGCIVLH
jgi:hypothetical protein